MYKQIIVHCIYETQWHESNVKRNFHIFKLLTQLAISKIVSAVVLENPPPRLRRITLQPVQKIKWYAAHPIKLVSKETDYARRYNQQPFQQKQENEYLYHKPPPI